MHSGFFLYRAGLVITRWMLEKDIIVTPTLQRGTKLDRVAPVDNRAPYDKNGAQNRCGGKPLINFRPSTLSQRNVGNH